MDGVRDLKGSEVEFIEFLFGGEGELIDLHLIGTFLVEVVPEDHIHIVCQNFFSEILFLLGLISPEGLGR